MSAPKVLPDAVEYCPTTTRKRLTEHNTLILDVRSDPDYALMQLDVQDSVHIPFDALEARFSELPKDRDLVVVSADGSQSLKATYFLMYQGFSSVANMKMGIAQWIKRDFPVIGDREGWQTKHPAGESEGCC